MNQAKNEEYLLRGKGTWSPLTSHIGLDVQEEIHLLAAAHCPQPLALPGKHLQACRQQLSACFAMLMPILFEGAVNVLCKPYRASAAGSGFCDGIC